MKVRLEESKNPRTGKPLTVIRDIIHNPQVIDKLAKKLKSACGAGGHVDGKNISIQGSHLPKVKQILEKDGYEVNMK